MIPNKTATYPADKLGKPLFAKSENAVGTYFKDADCFPEMVIVPAGTFMMGSPADEEDRSIGEGPQHCVTIPQAFAIGRYAVTFAEWDAYVAAGPGRYRPGDAGWGRGDRPVINVSWDDVQAYLAWLSEQSGATYRLPSEAEWEYAARAGTSEPFWWGASISTAQANYDGNHTYGGGKKGDWRKKTVAVQSFDPNPWGLYQVHGNVWEWCADSWRNSYKDKPEALKTDGGAWTTGNNGLRVLRGGSSLNFPQSLRSASRDRRDASIRSNFIGFRVFRSVC